MTFWASISWIIKLVSYVTADTVTVLQLRVRQADLAHASGQVHKEWLRSACQGLIGTDMIVFPSECNHLRHEQTHDLLIGKKDKVVHDNPALNA